MVMRNVFIDYYKIVINLFNLKKGVTFGKKKHNKFIIYKAISHNNL